jgi:hypothetical protein
MGTKRNPQRTWEFLQEEDYSEDLGIHGRIILTCTLKK